MKKCSESHVDKRKIFFIRRKSLSKRQKYSTTVVLFRGVMMDGGAFLVNCWIQIVVRKLLLILSKGIIYS